MCCLTLVDCSCLEITQIPLPAFRRSAHAKGEPLRHWQWRSDHFIRRLETIGEGPRAVDDLATGGYRGRSQRPGRNEARLPGALGGESRQGSVQLVPVQVPRTM